MLPFVSRFSFVLVACFPCTVFGLQHQVGLELDFEQAYVSDGLASQIYGHRPGAHQRRHEKAGRKKPEMTSIAPDVKIMYHHIWKCGGTHFCEVAESDGFQVPKNVGCHRWRDAHAPLNLVDTGNGGELWRACGIVGNESDMHNLAATPFNFYGHECPINKRILENARGAGFRWMVILRDPLEQAVSWHRHVRQWTYVEPSISEWVTSPRISSGFDAFIDNLQTRWLAGSECAHIVCPSITNTTDKICAGCLRSAKENLRSMDAILEQRGRQVLGMKKLHDIGWPASVLDDARIETDETSEYVKNMGTDERALLSKMQGADIELFEWAKAEGII